MGDVLRRFWVQYVHWESLFLALSLSLYIYIYMYMFININMYMYMYNLCDIEFSCETVNLSFRRSPELFEVYAPCRVQLRQWSDVAMVAVSRREAYEAAAMGPRGVCLKDQGGAMPLCLSPHRKLTWQWKITIFVLGDTSSNGWFSIVVFNFAGVKGSMEMKHPMKSMMMTHHWTRVSLEFRFFVELLLQNGNV